METLTYLGKQRPVVRGKERSGARIGRRHKNSSQKNKHKTPPANPRTSLVSFMLGTSACNSSKLRIFFMSTENVFSNMCRHAVVINS